ncbi:ABC transporter permease [Evansella cellulosilytica]|uniref:ABC transporter permease n=1 Tax=Evansella cellulosilytica (strain ATCC 21833 / DSM 2522 / FERM P-1141 / JCM 9156 / N-4) TaxID=649639 RepID=E6TWP3_EVAC2|nr:ABC transporter permease subunit [Evansella cellulosilytica]ADU28726.1 hypothetical protein Bcell_0444 [Evansella cellulosilytica DSM 2522]
MWQLFKNEWIKLWSKKQNWFFIGALIIITIFVGIMHNQLMSDPYASETGDWQVGLEMEIAHQEEIIATTDEEWEKEWAQELINEHEAYLEAGVDPTATTNMTFINSTLLGIASFITLFSVIVSSTIVSSEVNSGTIKQLVIRPYERWQFLLSKFMIVVVYMLILIATLFITNFLIGTIFYEAGSFSDPIIERSFMGETAEWTVGPLIFAKIGLYILNTLVFIVISFSLSTLFKNQALAVGIGIFTLFATSMLSQSLVFFLEDTAWFKFIFISHLNLPQYVAQETLMEGVTLPFSLVVLSIYVIVFLAITTVFFQKRDIAY